ncbi:acyltransferase [Methanosarcina sp. Mfa9]|uniref:acyltransferase n=1 Tax=Methanosarcina sp. Mfa9 TaxID=3439063 RepID=UPI003F87F89D
MQIKIRKIISNALNSLRLFYYRLIGINIGKYTYISPKVYIDKSEKNLIEIGENCYITRDCIILCHTQAYQGGPLKLWGSNERGKVKIGNNVFVGVDSVILPNITIGNNVVIGAKSLVNSDIPPNSIAFGIPCKRIKNLDEVISDIPPNSKAFGIPCKKLKNLDEVVTAGNRK